MSDELISKQAVLDALLAKMDEIDDKPEVVLGMAVAMGMIKAMPLVTPAEKVGHWIDDNKDEIDAQYGRHLYRCQICDKYAEYFVGGTEDWWDIEKPNYCPSCGAKMQEVEE